MDRSYTILKKSIYIVPNSERSILVGDITKIIEKPFGNQSYFIITQQNCINQLLVPLIKCHCINRVVIKYGVYAIKKSIGKCTDRDNATIALMVEKVFGIRI